MLYRQHRGSLADSMATIREVISIEDIRQIERGHGYRGQPITVEPYCFDERIGWDTHVVTAEGFGVLGFTNGPISS